MIKLVSDNTDAQVSRNHQTYRLHWRYRELAANLLRVVRGAGRPHDLAGQMLEVLDAYKAFHAATGAFPSDQELRRMLDPFPPAPDRWGEGRDIGHSLMEDGQEKAVAGALQIAASALVGQRTQAAAGEHEMFEGMRLIDDGRDAFRQEMGFTQRKRAKLAPKTQKRRASAKPKPGADDEW